MCVSGIQGVCVCKWGTEVYRECVCVCMCYKESDSPELYNYAVCSVRVCVCVCMVLPNSCFFLFNQGL